jgi:dihydroorotate dehydrogenase (fumarate)
MDLSTTYLGLRLPHPLMSGASPLADDLDTVRRLEDAGAAAIVMDSLFEEEVLNEQFREVQDVEAPEHTFPEALSYHPHRDEYWAIGPDYYPERVRKIKEAVSIPVIASLNGISTRAWVEYSAKCQQAGADALELNAYFLTTDSEVSGEEVENRIVEVVRTVRAAVTIPFAVKLSPFFSSIPHLVKRLGQAGADGVVLFNQFYQPDIDIDRLEVVSRLRLSEPSELLLRLRWLAILSGRVGVSLAVTGGVHSTADVVKAVMAGAHGVQMVSALLRHGPQHLNKLRQDLTSWMVEHEYQSMGQMRGSMSLLKCPDPAAFERTDYVRILKGGAKYV